MADVFDDNNLFLDIADFAGGSPAMQPMVDKLNQMVGRLNALSKQQRGGPAGGGGGFAGETTFLALHRDGISVELEVPFISETIVAD